MNAPIEKRKQKMWRRETPEQVRNRLSLAASHKKKKTVDLSGQRFGSLLILKWSRGGHHGPHWLCQCDCGTEMEVQSRALKWKNPGCPECAVARRTKAIRKHGDSYGNGKSGARLYRIWAAMVRRCTPGNTAHHSVYARYGIKVCDAWLEYTVFRVWALGNGYQEHLTIDRQNSFKNYEPGNCEWVTKARNSSRAGEVTNAKMALALMLMPPDLPFEYTPPEMFGLL